MPLAVSVHNSVNNTRTKSIHSLFVRIVGIAIISLDLLNSGTFAFEVVEDASDTSCTLSNSMIASLELSLSFSCVALMFVLENLRLQVISCERIDQKLPDFYRFLFPT
jgi:hypothetical protein